MSDLSHLHRPCAYCGGQSTSGVCPKCIAVQMHLPAFVKTPDGRSFAIRTLGLDKIGLDKIMSRMEAAEEEVRNRHLWSARQSGRGDCKCHCEICEPAESPAESPVIGRANSPAGNGKCQHCGGQVIMLAGMHGKSHECITHQLDPEACPGIWIKKQ